jgi:putative ABC transport system substrate-binding protein
VHVLVAGSPSVIRAAMAATTTIPIVMPVSGDPVEQGFVASLARPGGNVTGLTSVSVGLSGKRLEVLRDTVPDLSHVAVLRNADNSARSLELAETESAAQELGIARVLALAVRSPSELEAAFASATEDGATALIVLGDPLFNRNHERITELTRAYHLPAIFESPDLVRAGGG